MENSKQPIHPKDLGKWDKELMRWDNVETMYGLTKREYFAIKLLQGLYANSGLNEPTGSVDNSPSFLIGKAIEGADELLKKLGK